MEKIFESDEGIGIRTQTQKGLIQMQEKKSWLIPWDILQEYLKKAFPKEKEKEKKKKR